MAVLFPWLAESSVGICLCTMLLQLGIAREGSGLASESVPHSFILVEQGLKRDECDTKTTFWNS